MYLNTLNSHNLTYSIDFEVLYNQSGSKLGDELGKKRQLCDDIFKYPVVSNALGKTCRCNSIILLTQQALALTTLNRNF